MTDRGATQPLPFRTATRTPEQALAIFGPEELARRLRAVQRITDAALAHLKLEPLINELLRRVQSLLDTDTVRVLMCSPDQRSLTVRATLGLDEAAAEPVTVPIGLGISGWVAHHRRAVIVDDISQVRVANPVLRRLKSLMVAPLLVEGELLGVLKAGTIEARRFSDAELALLQMTADRVALAIDRAQQFEATQNEVVERRRHEAELEQSEKRLRDLSERFQSLFDNNPDAVFALDAEGRFESLNPAAIRISGYSPDELIGRPFLPLVLPEDRERAIDAFRSSARGEPRTLHLSIARRDGEERTLDISTVPITVDDRVTGVFGVASDVTERRRAEAGQRRLMAQLDSERASLETVLRQLPTGVLIAEAPSGRIVLGNERAEQILGHPLRQIRSLEEYGELHALHADGSPVAASEWPLARAIRDGETVSNEQMLYLRGDGSRGWIRVNAAPIRNAEGEVVGGVVVLNDIDRERRAAEAMRFLAEVSSTLFASLDYRTTLREVTRLAVPRFADWCTLSLLDAEGEPRQQEVAHHDPGREAVLRQIEERYGSTVPQGSPIRRVLVSGEPLLIEHVTDELLRQHALDAEHLELIRSLGLHSAICVPLRSRDGVLGVITFATAESQRRYGTEDLALAEEVARRSVTAIENAGLYEAAHAASQAKSNFLAVMSHELRTPLTAIMGYSELLLMGVPVTLPQEAQRQVERIDAAARHQLQLIEEILTFSRLAAGEEMVEWNRLDLEVPLREAIEYVQPAADAKGIDLTVLPADTPPIESDAAKIRQILTNLLYNAVQFTAQGSIRVEREHDAAEVRIHIRDTGIGMASEHLEKIFEPFWQVRQTSTREVGGTGLGLTVARRSARLLGGEITVESRLGVGTTFTLHLPLPPPRGDAVAPPAAV